MLKTSAPGKVILFGEHAVVHKNSRGEYCLGISTAVDKRCYVEIEEERGGYITVVSKNLGIEKSKTFEEVAERIDNLRIMRSVGKDYESIKRVCGKHKLVPVYSVIDNIMMEACGLDIFDYEPVKITIDSEVPKGMGSSSSVCSATALAVTKYLEGKGKSFGDEYSLELLGKFANDGDMNAHGKASGIDAFTSTYGGWNTYTQDKGVKHLDIENEIPLVVVDTGKPARTDETVGYLRNLRNEKPGIINLLLDKMDEISHRALDLINKKADINEIGKLFFEYYDVLRRIDEIPNEKGKVFFNIPEFERIVGIAKGNGFYAKPTGGWGGGICIATGKNTDEIVNKYKREGFNCFKVKSEREGVRVES
ncbi:MAG: hypothetical protein ISS95_00290 [Candidatus Aenigmarchaeota archaeon]|nr:hypothetical protein [Candidatus Aenigmarchaeota archaeon]